VSDKALFLLLLLLISTAAEAQRFTVNGKVIDAASKESLPFVNVSIEGTTRGTTSGVDGRFHLDVSTGAVLLFSYVGYERKRFVIENDRPEFLMIALNETSRVLETVEVTAGENPAFKIIRKVVSNRTVNDPLNLESFSYKGYHKFYATVEGALDAPTDTTRAAKFLRKNHLFLNESFTARSYVKPNLDKETVLGNRMTGVNDPFFAVVATSFQPFSFYHEHIPLFEKNYLNPISPASLEKYDFEIADTIFHEADTTFIIKFEPLAGKTFEALQGLLYINTHGYALEHVLAQPADPQALMQIRIQQKYHLVEGHWFPEQINTEFLLKKYKLAKHNIKYIHRSYFTATIINQSIAKKEFGLLNMEFAPNANHQPEHFWAASRLDSLTRKERNTYQLYDSLDGRKLATLNALLKIAEAFIVGKFRVGRFYIPTENLIRFNEYEHIRFGFGLQTGERISRWVVLDGHGAYGVRDKAFKYGGGIQLNLSPSKDLYVKFSYRQDISEPGNANFIKGPAVANGGQALRNWLAARMDSTQQLKALLNLRPFRFSEVSIFLQQQKDNPAYTYLYRVNDVTTINKFLVTQAGVQWRYSLRERYAQVGNTKIVTKYDYPQINVMVSKAFDNLWGGKFDFTKVEAKLAYQFLFRGSGKTMIDVAAGMLHGNAPYPYLFNGKGAFLNRSLSNSFMVPNHFQTMGLYEFASDRYTYLFLTHNFGRLTTTKNKYFRPEVSLLQNMGVGSLRNLEAHEGITFSTLEKGFFESGMMLSNILRFEYARILYYGLGAGAFYRYGSYAFPSSADNLVLKVIISVGF
jgi:hypothetical protein